MPTPEFTVLAADFLEDASIEQSVFGDSVRLVMAKAMHESELVNHLPEADAILLFHDIEKISEASFKLAPKLKCVVRAGVGYNNVDVPAATRHGVIVCNVPDYGTEEVADHAIMFLLALALRMVVCL
jgi:lactate dehydrogenase-like 2-hydroxyacid dehydrogenase